MTACSISNVLANFQSLVGFLLACLVTVPLCWLFARCARNKQVMTVLGFLLFAIGFFIYFGIDSSTEKASVGIEQSHDSNTNKLDAAVCAKTNDIIDNGARALDAVNRTLSAFYPSRGDYDRKLSGGWKTLAYWLFHLAAILYIFVLAISFFCIELMNLFHLEFSELLRRFKLKRSRPNVIWSHGAEAESLAESLKDEEVIFVLPPRTQSWRSMQDDERVCSLVRKGITWVTDSEHVQKTLAKAKRHFFVGDDAHENVAKAQHLIGAISSGPSKDDIKIYVRVWPEADDDAVFNWADKINKGGENKGGGVEVVTIREESIVSRKFLVDYPMLECPGIRLDQKTSRISSGDFRVLVIGFGVQGERLTGDMIADAQFIDKDGKAVAIAVDVIDKDAASFGWFKGNCGEACKRYNMRFEQLDLGEERFWHWLKGRDKYSRIVICTQDDVVNLQVANDIANYYSQRYRMPSAMLQKTIFARVRRPSMIAALGRSADRFRIFGDLGMVYSKEWLVDKKWDEGGVFINGVWSAKYDSHMPEYGNPLRWFEDNNKDGELGKRYWRAASTFNKESSRASFLHMRNLLRLLGFRMFSSKDEMNGYRNVIESQIEEIVGLLEDKKRMAALAESEHMRWEAFHFVRGWGTWNPQPNELNDLADALARKKATKPEGEEARKSLAKEKLEPNAMKKCKLHGDLVDYDRLDELDEQFNAINRAHGWELTNSKEKDEAIVWGIESVYAAGFFVGRKEEDCGSQC